MTSLRASVRRWWQPPKNIRDREEERSVTFLELFYDLVYVATLIQIEGFCKTPNRVQFK